MRKPTLAALIALSCFSAPPAAAWPANLMQSLARDARRLLPKSLNRLIGEREEAIFAEALKFPPELQHALSVDLNSGRLRPDTLAAAQSHTRAFFPLLREKRVSEALVMLGATYRIPVDLSDPALSVGPVGLPPGVAGEYYAFVERNLAKIPIVIDERAALQMKAADLTGYWQTVLSNSRAQSHVIAEELWKQGRLVDSRKLDYRNPVFGVGSIAYSRAVNAIAVTWLALWREAGGDLTRMPVIKPVSPGPAATSNGVNE